MKKTSLFVVIFGLMFLGMACASDQCVIDNSGTLDQSQSDNSCELVLNSPTQAAGLGIPFRATGVVCLVHRRISNLYPAPTDKATTSPASSSPSK